MRRHWGPHPEIKVCIICDIISRSECKMRINMSNWHWRIENLFRKKCKISTSANILHSTRVSRHLNCVSSLIIGRGLPYFRQFSRAPTYQNFDQSTAKSSCAHLKSWQFVRSEKQTQLWGVIFRWRKESLLKSFHVKPKTKASLQVTIALQMRYYILIWHSFYDSK